MRSHRKLPFFLLRKVPTPRTDRGGPDSRSSEWGNNHLPKLGPLAGLCRVSLVGGTAPAGHPAMTHLACTRTADLPPRMRRGSLRPTACSLHHEASPPQFSFLLPESPPTARLPFPPGLLHRRAPYPRISPNHSTALSQGLSQGLPPLSPNLSHALVSLSPRYASGARLPPGGWDGGTHHAAVRHPRTRWDRSPGWWRQLLQGAASQPAEWSAASSLGEPRCHLTI